VHFHSVVTGLGLHEMRAAKESGARVIFTSHASSLGYICQRGTLMRLGRFPCDGLTEIVKCSTCELQHRGLPRLLGEVVAREPVRISKVLGAPENPLGTALGMPELIRFNQSSQKALLELVDSFVVLTQSAAAIVHRNGAPEKKLVVNALGMSAARAEPKPSPDTRPTTLPVKLGYLGRFDLVKGVIELAKALRAIPREETFEFEFRGPASTNADAAVLQRVREVCEGDSRITFAPAVSPDQVLDVLAGYDALVCPSICAEGGPTVAIESQAIGTPVIGTRIGGLAELVEHGVNGELVPPGDVNALTALLRRVISSPSQTIDSWRRNLSGVRTMNDVVDDYLELYDAALVAK
jgi:glycosyltransferase involved in cell wall biosynthesis